MAKVDSMGLVVSKCFPVLRWKIVEGEEFNSIYLQTFRHFWVFHSIVKAKPIKGFFSFFFLVSSFSNSLLFSDQARDPVRD